ncbi:MAG TPA: helix-turn-helix transcriptional regulator [Pseudonocardiaceae bacterium]|nr:helix-turn-helix transcriptional regulator [Pseudonocardiaceae bacterium]
MTNTGRVMTERRDGLARRRAMMGLTQEDLAEYLKVRPATVSRWECGITVPSPWMQPRLAKVLKLSITQLAALLSSDPCTKCLYRANGAVPGAETGIPQALTALFDAIARWQRVPSESDAGRAGNEEGADRCAAT